jgi:hypothetical protein
MNCPCCESPNNKPLVNMPAVQHCQDCGYLWNMPSADPLNGGMTPEGLRAAAAWGYPTTTSAQAPAPKPAIPENGPPLDYDERDFAVCLSTRIFAKDIIRERNHGDIARRDDRRDNTVRRMLDNLRRVG